ncbi:MAG: hypothetical protein HKN25_01135 [Pyrinomonadaceae bacterium]|nr:hypothetical protein [Pyrinomonadaceae bacterium]
MTYQVITFYKFKDLSELSTLKELLLGALKEHSIFGTIIIAEEGFNSTVCGETENTRRFVAELKSIFQTEIEYKSSFHSEIAFKRQKVKIKREIVTFRKDVDIRLGAGTHVEAGAWNAILKDPEMLVLDTRNEYEYSVGTFQGAFNPKTESFSELPDFVEDNLDPGEHKKIAIFCTGGIRCEKFASYLKSKGFEEVFQLEGGILRYLEEVPPQQSLWEGECFVFDERVSLDEELKKGKAPDLSVKKEDLPNEKDQS